MAAYQKSMTCILLDASPTMSAPIGSFASKFLLAQTFIHTHILTRTATKTPEYAVMTYGVNDYSKKSPPLDEYRNAVRQKQGGYDDVYEIVGMKTINQSTFDLMMKDLCIGTAPGDALDGLFVVQDTLVSIHANHKYNRIAVWITDGETPLTNSEEDELHMGVAVGSMNSKDMVLHVLMLGKISSTSSTTKQTSGATLRQLTQQTGGRYLEADDLAECLSLLAAAPGLSTKPQQRKQTLEIAPYLKVPVVVWNKCSAKSLPSLKKCVVIPPVDDGEEEKVMSVQRSCVYMNPHSEDDDVDLSDRIKGYRYGPQYIPISEDHEDVIKILGEQVIQLIGFVQASTIPRHHYLSNSQILLGDPDDPAAILAIQSLCEAMQQSNDVALTRFVTRDNSEPFLAALVPSASGDKSLVVHKLPFNEDIRDYAFPTFDISTLPSAQTDTMTSFVKSMTLDQREATKTIGRTFNPTRQAMLIEITKKMITKGESGGASVHADDLPPTQNCFRSPWLALGEGDFHADKREAIMAALQELTSSYTLKVTTSGGKGDKKRYWGQFDIEVTGGGDADGGDKRIKVEIKGESQAAMDVDVPEDAIVDEQEREEGRIAVAKSAVSNFANHILQVQEKVETFEAIVNTITHIVQERTVDDTTGEMKIVPMNVSDNSRAMMRGLLEQVMRAMIPVWDPMVVKGRTTPHYKAALAILQILRKTALDASNNLGLTTAHGKPLSQVFNDLLTEEVKQRYSTVSRHKEFWKLLVKEDMTLISLEEDGTSTITKTQAQEFLQEEVVDMVVSQAGAVVETESSDMFGEME